MARLSPTKSQAQLQLDDGYLLALARQGSHDAYDRLVRRYASFVRLKASSYFLVGGDSEDLIEAAQLEQIFASPEGHAALYCLIGWVRAQVHALAEQP